MRWLVVPWISLSLALVSSTALAAAPAPVSPPPPSDPPAAKTGSRRATPPVPSPSSAPPSPGDATAGSTAATSETELPPQDLAETWNYNRRGTQRPRYVRSTDDPILFAPNPIGFYSGVSVEGNQIPPIPANKAGRRTAMLTWTGFERTAVGSQVFFQLSADATHSVSAKGTKITIRIKNTKVTTRNNSRRLDLRYFKTPVQYVRVRRRGRDVVATITLKRVSEPDVNMIDDASGTGYKLLVVRFAEGARTRPNDGPPPPPQ